MCLPDLENRRSRIVRDLKDQAELKLQKPRFTVSRERTL
jgi:hypothetical protein